ncbi:insulin-degrading enzyme, putative [Ichthyophthirius multifiliis]|uniref:Insulin-degrading enzyme, putative n=1 Tax=Ichthyophthirius multifiliis TaxID=5932 RepID=G0R2S0_ICHMU|nr:insulin-degrading enzyme, putative [Ichthyophthirius multifiliis]EGR28234.1 insulin-degrading enzyme, putative [Ichthyophthirius multifiliis]|eukprot:XP_004027579.1 insulin-degrading enzyme, putative [Ichthyophthirius multifiliis]
MSESLQKRHIQDEEQAIIQNPPENSSNCGYLQRNLISREDLFDREKNQSLLKRTKTYLSQLFIGNQSIIEKSCIFITIVALITVLVGISIIIISTFNAQNLKRKEQFASQYIIKPKTDQNNTYKLLTLPNKLQIMLISNKQAQYSAVSLDVQAGSWQEPQQVLGLSHFLEHMIFLKCEKYPEKGYLDQILSKNGGYSNAYTEDDNTNFYYKTQTKSLEETLDIFANMFISPIFDEDSIQKESSAVDDEYQIDLAKEDFKLESLLKQISDPIHPFSRFSVGNTQTLLENKEINIKDELYAFKSKFYTPNVMKLVVYTNEDLDKVEKYVQVFSNIPEDNNSNEKTNFQLFGKPIKDLGQIIKLKGENDKFSIFFQLDFDRKNYKKRPLEFLDYFLQNEKEGSLVYFLKNKESLILDFSTEKFLDQQNFLIFHLKFTLQKTENFSFENSYKKITNSLLNYLDFLKTQPILDQIYHEKSKIQDLSFTFKTSSTFSEKDIAQFAKNLNFFNYKEVLATQSLYQDQFDKQQFIQILNQMQDIAQSAILVLQSPNFSEKTAQESLFKDNEFDNNVPLFSLEYSQRTLSETSIQEMTNIDQEFQKNTFITPQLNPFVPFSTKLIEVCNQNEMQINLEQISQNELQKKSENQDFLKKIFKNFDFSPEDNTECDFQTFLNENMNQPQLIKYQKGVESWFLFDQYFLSPKTAAYFAIQMPNMNKNIKQYSIGAVYAQIFENELQKEISQALIADYKLDIQYKNSQIRLYVEGWSENFPQVIQKIFEIYEKMQINSEQFNLAVQQQAEYFSKFKEQNPIEQGFYIFLQKSLKKSFFEPEEVLSNLNKLKIENIQQIKEKEKNTFKLTSLFIGNIQAKQAQDILQNIENITTFSDKNLNLQQQQQIININKLDSYFIRVKNQGTENNKNRGLVNYYQIGERNARNYAILNTFIQDLNTYLFQFLRSEKQLGYQVQAQLLTIGNIDSLIISILGDQVSAPEMNNYVNEALIKYREQLPDQLEQYLQLLKEAAQYRLNKHKDSLKETMEYLVQKMEGLNYSFESDQLSINELEYLTEEDIIYFYDQIFFEEKRLISIQVHNQEDSLDKKIQGNDNITNEKIMVINDEKTLKNFLSDKSFFTISGNS